MLSEKVKVAGALGLSLAVILGISTLVISTSKKSSAVVETPTEIAEPPSEVSKLPTKKYTITNISAEPSQVILINTEISYESVRLAISRLEQARLAGETHMYLVIDSPGGSVVDGTELTTYMTSSSMRIDTYCRAICASMAAQIHQVGDTRYIAEKGILMFHPASGGAQGTLEQMKSQIDMFKRYVDRLDAEVARRSGIPYEKFKAMLVSELWLEGVDAMDLNLADKIASLRFGESFTEPSEVFDLKKELDKIRKPNTPKAPSQFTIRDIK